MALVNAFLVVMVLVTALLVVMVLANPMYWLILVNVMLMCFGQCISDSDGFGQYNANAGGYGFG